SVIAGNNDALFRHTEFAQHVRPGDTLTTGDEVDGWQHSARFLHEGRVFNRIETVAEDGSRDLCVLRNLKRFHDTGRVGSEHIIDIAVARSNHEVRLM